MITIWKYPLSATERQIIFVPKGAQFLSVQVQRDELCLWAKVDTEHKESKVEIVVHGTGHNADDTKNMEYVGTFQESDGFYVGHCFAAFI